MAMTVYMLRCADGSYYVGSTKKDVAARLWEHNEGLVPAYTRSRRPVVLVYAQEFDRFDEAGAFERRLKGWSRAKKEALIHEDVASLKRLAKNRTQYPR